MNSFIAARAALHAWLHGHASEILTDPDLEQLARAALRLDAEASGEVARLHAALDAYQGRMVYHATAGHAADAMMTLTDAPPGAVVRATDTGQEWERLPDGTWDLRS